MNNEPAVQFSTTQQFVASSSLHEFQHRLQFRVALADDNTSYSPFRKKDRRDCPPLRGGNDFFSCPTNVSHRTLSVPPSSFTFLRQVSRQSKGSSGRQYIRPVSRLWEISNRSGRYTVLINNYVNTSSMHFLLCSNPVFHIHTKGYCSLFDIIIKIYI